MGCCGKQTKVEATRAIIKAHINRDKCKDYDLRIITCKSCDHHTWLSRKERLNWIICNLGKIIVRPNKISEKTSKLPVNLEPMEHGILCCQECRCVCEVKAREPELKCCLDKWRE